MPSVGPVRERALGRRWRAAAATVAVTLATALVTVTSSAPAQAAPEDCLNGANGFVNTPATVKGAETAKSVTVYGLRIDLRYGNINGAQRGWARISGDLFDYDRVWLDWSTNGGTSWVQCGPFSARDRTFTPAQRTSNSTQWVFRACGRPNPPNTQSYCTGWW